MRVVHAGRFAMPALVGRAWSPALLYSCAVQRAGAGPWERFGRLVALSLPFLYAKSSERCMLLSVGGRTVAKKKDPEDVVASIQRSIEVSPKGSRRVRCHSLRALFGFQAWTAQRKDFVAALLAVGIVRCHNRGTRGGESS